MRNRAAEGPALLHRDHVLHELIEGDLGALIEARRFVFLEVRFIPVHVERWVYPILLGRGKRCFSDSADQRKFALVSSKAAPTGVLLNIYRRS